ncbi:DUF456 domain-containing protein [Haloparvum alkalitolerans]|uniref:DUF456 domain-containing protein n=1 Tax=Haloparvum alkalitolerans TaxID=1042953 RepID=UPI003CEA9D60
MVEPATLVTGVTLALLLGGVVGSVVPMLPSGLLSLAGVGVYAVWGAEGIGPLLLASLVLVALAAAVLEQFAGPLTARATGASTRTMLIAAGAGVLLFFVTGPVGILIGSFGAVLLLELHRGETGEDAVRRAGYTVLGMLGSAVMQVLLTGSVLAGFVLFVLVL